MHPFVYTQMMSAHETKVSSGNLPAGLVLQRLNSVHESRWMLGSRRSKGTGQGAQGQGQGLSSYTIPLSQLWTVYTMLVINVAKMQLYAARTCIQ